MDSPNSFDRLVSGLSVDERQSLLSKMKGGASDPEEESLASIDTDDSDDGATTLSARIKQEPFFFRILLWIKSIFSNTSIEQIYNEHLISSIARNIEHTYPGLLDSKRGFLQSLFYEKLNELKLCADFFKPYFAAEEEDTGAYIVFLGSLMMPQVAATMDSEIDPYSMPLTRGATPELRAQLMRRLDQVLNTIPQDQRNAMYAATRSSEWLHQFTKLPFSHFLALFTSVISDNYTCPFGQVEDEVSDFARILCSGQILPEEVLEALYLFSVRNYNAQNFDTIDSKNSASEFMDKARAQVAMMHMFITTVPLRSIGCVVYENAHWQPDKFGGGEDWFVKYKAQWKKLFDQKWEAWSHDCKKEVLRQKLQEYFDLIAFPLLPDRPWSTIWGGVPFRYELTGGFLFWYFREQFPTYELTLKTLMLEGDFVQKENRLDFTDAYNDLIGVSLSMDGLTQRLLPSGETGLVFAKLSNEHLRTLQGQAKVDSLILGAETEIGGMISKFGAACREMDLVLTGILGDKKDTRYDTISNLSTIQGKNNEEFRKQIEAAKHSLADAYDLVKELEPVDTPSLAK